MDENNGLPPTSVVGHLVSKNKNIELFNFGSNQKLQYEGFCTIVVNGFSQLLEIKTTKADYLVPFNRRFISKNSALLIIAPKRANDLALYFSNKKNCESVLDAITKIKSRTVTTIATPDENTDENLFNERFGKPLFNETFMSGNLRLKSIFGKVMMSPPDSQPSSPAVIKNPENQSVLKRLLNEKVVQQEKAQNLKISKIEKDNKKVLQSPIITLNPFTLDQNRGTLTTSLDADKNQAQLTSHKIATDGECSNKYKRNIDFVDNFSNVNSAAATTDDETSSNKIVAEINTEPPRKKQKLKDSIFAEDSIKRPSLDESPSFADKFIFNQENFEIHSSFKKGSEKYILIIPNSLNKNLCYRYGFNPLHKQFSCGYCRANHKISVTATLHKTDSGEFYIEQNRAHECSLLTLKSSDKNKKLLKVDEYEKLLSKGYPQKSPSSHSKIINDSNSSGLHETENAEIINIAKQNVSENMTDDNSKFDRKEENKNDLTILSKENNQINSTGNLIIKVSNIKLGQTEKSIPTLEIILSNQKKYIYRSYMKNSNYCCIKCRKEGQNITAKLCKNIKNDEDYVLLNNENHVCEPQIAEKEVIPPERIIKNGNFKFFVSKHGIQDGKLEITHSDGNKYFYTRNTQKLFICGKCQRQASLNVTARIVQDESQDEPYLILNKNKHICQKYERNIQKFLQKSDDSIKNKNTVEAACEPKAQSEVPSKIEFEIFPDSKGIPNSKLIIFDGNDFTKGRDYYLENGLFKCAECFVKRKIVPAKICKNQNGEEFIELGSESHICELINLSSHGRVLKIRKLDEIPKEIIVPYFADRKLCYKFIFNEDLKVFHCQSCKDAGINVFAKFTTNQNDQTFLVLSSNHLCSPILASELQTLKKTLF